MQIAVTLLRFGLPLLLFLAGIPYFTLHAEAPPQPASEEQEVLRLSEEWMQAAMQRDEAKLQQLMAPEFALRFQGGLHPPVPRETWLDDLLKRIRYTLKYTSKDAKVYGNLAVVTSTFTWEGTFGEKPFAGSGFLIDVWVKREGRWQVVSRTSGRLEELVDAGMLPAHKRGSERVPFPER